MINPNNILTAQATTQAVQTTFNAWHVVALGVGAAVTHFYHTVVNAGGVKKLWSNFWNGQEKAEGGKRESGNSEHKAESGKRESENENTKP